MAKDQPDAESETPKIARNDNDERLAEEAAIQSDREALNKARNAADYSPGDGDNAGDYANLHFGEQNLDEPDGFAEFGSEGAGIGDAAATGAGLAPYANHAQINKASRAAALDDPGQQMESYSVGTLASPEETTEGEAFDMSALSETASRNLAPDSSIAEGGALEPIQAQFLSGAYQTQSPDEDKGAGEGGGNQGDEDNGSSEPEGPPENNAGGSGDSAGEGGGPEVEEPVAENGAPVDIVLLGGPAPENVEGGFVAELSAIDPDAGDLAIFSIVDDPSGLFEISGNVLKLKDGAAFDFEAQTAHDITLRVTDNAGASYDETVTIDVANVNEAPVVAVVPQSGLRASYYNIGHSLSDLDQVDFAAAPTAQGVVAELDYMSGGQAFWDGAPGDYFAAKYEGRLIVEEGGTYTFDMASDDGSMLFIDGLAVLDNDGLHSTRTRSVTLDLEAGPHDIEVRYFENGGSQTLQLAWSGPDTGGVTEVIGGSSFEHGASIDGLSVADDETGAIVARLSVSDPDTEDTHSFSVNDDRFEVIEIDGGAFLKLKDGVSIDYEAEPTLNVEVTVTDAGGASSTIEIPIVVENTNHAPSLSLIGGEGLHASYYNIGHSLNDLDQVDFDAAPTAEGVVSNLNYMAGQEAFWDGAPGDYFAAKYEGQLMVSEGGIYTFDMASDDGSMLLIDGVAVLDNDGLHSTRTRSVTLDLEAGSHEIEVRYFENGGSQTLQLAWSGPDTGGVTEVIGGESFRLPGFEDADRLGIAENAAGDVAARFTVSDAEGDVVSVTASDDRFEVVEDGDSYILKLKDGVEVNYETESEISVTVTATDEHGEATAHSFAIPVLNADETPVNFALAPQSHGGSLSLNQDGGADDAAIAANMEGFPTDALTVEVRFSSDQTDVGDGTPLFSYAASGGSDNEALIWLEGASGKLHIFLAGQKINTGVPNASLLDGEEHQVSFTWDQTSNELKVYIDGETAFETSINIRDLKTGGTLAFGQEQDNEGGGFVSNQIFEGEIAEVRIFDYARSEAEIADNAGVAIGDPETEPGLVNNWVMNSAEGGFIEDLAGADNLQLVNGAHVEGGETYDAPTVLENRPGAVAGVLSADDPNTGEAITTFSIVNDPSAAFEIDGNVLKLKDGVSLDHETQASYEIVVEATGPDGETAQQTFTVSVADENEAPVDVAFDPASAVKVLSLNQDGGADDAALASNLEGFPTDALTVEVRFASDQADVGNGAPLFSYAANDGSNNEVLLFLEGASGKLNIYLAGQKINTGVTNDSLLDGQEHQVSFSWDQASNELKLYVDGDVAFETSINIRDLKAGGALAFGQEQDSEGGGFDSAQVFEGEIAEVRIFDYARSAAEIAEHTGAPIGNPDTEPGLINNWVMNAAEGGVIEDLVGGNDLQLVNGATVQNSASSSTPLIAENDSGALVGALSARDRVTGEAISDFAIADDPSGLFEIEGGQLKLKEGAALDYEAQQSHDIIVQAIASNGETTQVTVTVQVADIAELNPIIGADGDDRLRGTNQNDYIDGGAGDDNIAGGAGADELYGGAGDDVIRADAQDTVVDGGEGNDRVIVETDDNFTIDMAASNVERVDGRGGDDVIDGSGATDRVVQIGNGGNDTLTGGSGDDVQRGGAGDDVIMGGEGDDNIAGGAGADELYGGAGDDVIRADAQDTVVDGGEGNDRVIVETDDNFTIDMAASNVERVDGRGGDDVIDGAGATDRVVQIGNGGNDTLTGGSGDDVQRGGAGDDVIMGGAGDDNIAGGAGVDTTVYSGNRADYTVTQLNETTYRVVDNRDGSPDGTDIVRTVENFEFADQTISSGNILNAPPTDIHLTLAETMRSADATVTNSEISTSANGGGSASAQVNLAGAAAGSAEITVSFAYIDNSFELLLNGESLSGETLQLQSNVYQSASQAFLQFGDGAAMNSPWVANSDGSPRLIAHITSDGVEILATRTPSSGVYESMTIVNGEFSAPDFVDGVNTVTVVNPDDDGPDGISAVVSAQYEQIVEGPVSGDAGAVIGSLSSTDADAAAAPAYSIVEDASGLFEISGSQLKLKDGMSLDHETQAAHEVTIKVTDENGVSYEETLTINVQEESTASQHLYGDAGDNVLAGDAGDDLIYGGAGDDTIAGNAGDDVMSGGEGSDVFVYAMGDGSDEIAGGAGWTDVIDLADGSAPLGEFGTDWTVDLTQGSITSATDGSIVFTDDAAGAISLSDGSVINFSEIEQLTY